MSVTAADEIFIYDIRRLNAVPSNAVRVIPRIQEYFFENPQRCTDPEFINALCAAADTEADWIQDFANDCAAEYLTALREIRDITRALWLGSIDFENHPDGVQGMVTLYFAPSAVIDGDAVQVRYHSRELLQLLYTACISDGRVASTPSLLSTFSTNAAEMRCWGISNFQEFMDELADRRDSGETTRDLRGAAAEYLIDNYRCFAIPACRQALERFFTHTDMNFIRDAVTRHFTSNGLPPPIFADRNGWVVTGISAYSNFYEALTAAYPVLNPHNLAGRLDVNGVPWYTPETEYSETPQETPNITVNLTLHGTAPLNGRDYLPAGSAPAGAHVGQMVQVHGEWYVWAGALQKNKIGQQGFRAHGAGTWVRCKWPDGFRGNNTADTLKPKRKEIDLKD